MQSVDVTIHRESCIKKTPRVMQVESMFDVPSDEKQSLSWDVKLPLDEQDWNVGLIVGPSGAGKTTVAREIYGAELVDSFEWNHDQALVDAFPAGMSIKDIGGHLSSVGLSTIPAWLRPFDVLSNGEQFRATIARALAETDGLIVVDEFTSVVDRNVAKAASHATQKAIRRAGRQFVAVTCHYDVLDWLQPDWVYEPQLNRFKWRRLRQHPELKLNIHPVDKSAWRTFRHHHYLSGNLHSAAKCWGAFLGDECVAFCAVRKFPHPVAKNVMQAHRLVVLPDFQGLGIGSKFSDWMGQYLYERNLRFHYVVAHPAMVRMLSKSRRWKMTRHGKQSGGGIRGSKSLKAHQKKFSSRRNSATFVYVPPKMSKE